MCGINGLISKNSIDNIEKVISDMNNLIHHRGPDASGLHIENDKRIALGMRRLAIIDIANGYQPMYSYNKSIVIIFNGEIYNYLELQKELQGLASFKTNSDTEVILKGYELFGTKFFEKLNGMFAIAIYDKNIDKLFLVRDRTGEKPLYFWNHEDFFVFGSELKSLKSFCKNIKIRMPSISDRGLNLYFNLTFIPAPYSIYNDIYKIEPGAFLEIDTRSLTINKNYYWKSIEIDFRQKYFDYSKAKLKVRDLIYNSVEKRMISDVPYGAFLSGGVDSSIITAVMADIKKNDRIKTFSIVSKNSEYDESIRSNAVSKHLNTEHYAIEINYKNIESDLEKILLNFDEPFADSSALPSYFVSKETSKFVKVALTGDGGDEVFGGYNRYLMPNYSRKYKKFIKPIIHNSIVKPLFSAIKIKSDKRGKIFKIKKFLNAIGKEEHEDYLNIICLGFLPIELNCLFKKQNSLNFKDILIDYKIFNDENLSTLSKSRYLDLKISLEGDMLVKVDRTSMQNSLECRSPFLDHRLIELSYQLPDKFLISKNQTKLILKESFEKQLPTKIFDLPKSGFAIPIGDWLRESLKNELLQLTSKELIKSQDLFNYECVSLLVNNHLNGSEDNTFKVWTLFCFQKWWKKNYIDEEA